MPFCAVFTLPRPLWALLWAALWLSSQCPVARADLPWVRVEDRGFVLADERQTPLFLWGVNYDHDATAAGRLLEDYWHEDWSLVEEDFAEMRSLGVNAVRVHLQTARFVRQDGGVERANLDRLAQLIALSERHGLYLLITGLGFYHDRDTPRWIQQLDEAGRWELHARFWRAVAAVCRDQPAVLAYDLANEPVIPAAGSPPASGWLLGALGGKTFAQRLALDPAGRAPEAIAGQWLRTVVAAVREVDQRHLITVGVIAQEQARLLFYADGNRHLLDFVSVHIYPPEDAAMRATRTLARYRLDKPLVVTEIFPMSMQPESLAYFMARQSPGLSGWFSFYWGKTPAEYRRDRDRTMEDALMARWLPLYQALIQRAATPVH